MINIYGYIKFFATQNYKQQEACRECWKEKQLETFVVTLLAAFYTLPSSLVFGDFVGKAWWNSWKTISVNYGFSKGKMKSLECHRDTVFTMQRRIHGSRKKRLRSSEHFIPLEFHPSYFLLLENEFAWAGKNFLMFALTEWLNLLTFLNVC